VTKPSAKPRKWHRWLLLAPFAWQLGAAPFINDVEIPGVPVPFPLIWQMLGVILTSVVIALVFRMDAAAGNVADDGEESDV